MAKSEAGKSAQPRQDREPRTRKVGRPRGTGMLTVYQLVRDDILRLRRRPGESLDEGSLEQQFKVSRTPVREALIRLASEGLVHLMPNRGATVAYLDVNEIPQLFEALELFQRTAYRWCAIRRNDATIEALQEHNDAFRAAAKDMDVEEMGDANRNFHMIIGDGCGNVFVKKTYETLLNESLRLATTMFASAVATHDFVDYFNQIADEHQETIDTLQRGDADAAERLAIEHNHLFRNQVTAYLGRNLSPGTGIPDPIL